MKFTTAATAALASYAYAYPHLAEEAGISAAELEKRQDTHPYILNNNNINSARSPCPGTNTLANHGFIDRNGFCVTKQQYQQGFLDAFNMAFSVTDPGTTNAINLCTSLNGGRPCTCFRLDQLATPHTIEHDSSLTRRDKKYLNNPNADNQRFNQTIWDRSLQLIGSATHLGTRYAQTVKIGRAQQAQRVDAPGWWQPSDGGSYAEAAFYLSAMNDPAFGVNLATPGANPAARMDWIDYWFVNMRLPTALGWHKPAQTITGPQVSSLAAAVSAAPTIPPPRGTNPFQKTHPPPIVGAMNKRGATPNDVWDDETYEWVPLKHRDVPVNILSSASSAAVAAATPAPPAVNAFSQILTPEEWSSHRAAAEAHVQDVQNLFDQAVADIQAGRAPPQPRNV